MNENPEILYFGRIGSSGHHLHSKRTKIRYEETPWGMALDTGILKADNIPDVVDGKTVIHWKDGWTIIAFWDRSGDSRPGSNSAFIVRQEMNSEKLLLLAQQQWPEIFSRLEFPIKPSGAPSCQS